MKPLLRVVLIVNALIFLAFGLLFLLTPWAGLYGALQLDSIRVQPAFAGQLFGVALIGLAWLSIHAAVDGALTAAAAKASGHVEWLSGIVVLVWLLGLRTPEVDGLGQVIAAALGVVLLVLGLGSVRLSSAVRRRERAALAGAAAAQRAEKKAGQTRDERRDTVVTDVPDDARMATPAVTRVPPDTAVRPSARAPEVDAIDPITGRTVDSSGRPLDTRPLDTTASTMNAAPAREFRDGGAVDPVTGGTLDPATGRTFDPVSGREIDPLTGKRIEPVISGEIDPATGRRVDPLTGRLAPGSAPEPR